MRANRACGSNSGRPAASATSRSGSPSTSAPSRPSSRNSTALVDDDYVVKIYRKLERRHQSRDRDRPLPDRGRRLCQHAGAARQRRTGRRQRDERGRRRSCLRRESGRRLDRDRGLSRPLCRGAAPAGGKRCIPARARSRSPICATCRRPAGASPRCMWRWPAAASLPTSRRSRSRREDVQRWIDDI